MLILYLEFFQLINVIKVKSKKYQDWRHLPPQKNWRNSPKKILIFVNGLFNRVEKKKIKVKKLILGRIRIRIPGSGSGIRIHIKIKRIRNTDF